MRLHPLSLPLLTLLACTPKDADTGPTDTAETADTDGDPDSGDTTDSGDSGDTTDSGDSGDTADSDDTADSGDTTDSGDSADTAPADHDADGWAADQDCDDDDPGVHPGAPETCDERDQDCDGEVDEGVTSTWWEDEDEDGYGDPASPWTGCAAPPEYVDNDDDCDDNDDDIYPRRELEVPTDWASAPARVWGSAAADVDADGDLDLYGLDLDGNVALLLNDGTGAFADATTVATAAEAESLAAGDVDGDGDADALVADYEGYQVVLHPAADGLLGEGIDLPLDESPNTLDLPDVDGDGVLDLAWTSNEGIGVYLGDGAGGFEAGFRIDLISAIGAAWADLDGDGRLDVAAGVWGGQVVVHLLGADGVVRATQTVETGGDALHEVIAADLDGDGDLDLASAHYGGNLDLLLNDGAGSFTLSGTLTGLPDIWGLGAGDLDLDGNTDLVAGGWALGIYRGLGDGRFGELETIGEEYLHTPNPADFDGDGDTDVGLVRWGGTVGLVRSVDACEG